ncbi:MAG: CDP-alcohol phosphatidyltransferase family protein [Candidatus Glassbacteria bacterium]
MSANMITVIRILLAFLTIYLYGKGYFPAFIAFFLTIIVIYLDALDGYIARKFGAASDFGALLDITGDRIVENIYWIYFATIGMVTFWIPVFVIARGFLTDTVRSVAFAEGMTPFGEKTMMKSTLTRLLVSSRVSRGLYGVLKAVVFCYLGFIVAMEKAITYGAIGPHEKFMTANHLISSILVWVVFFMCIIRGLPVLWDGKEYVLAKRFPREIKNES